MQKKGFLSFANSWMGDVLLILLTSVAFMYFMSWGSFEPNKSGFYIAIITSVVIHYSVKFIVRKATRK